MRAVCVGLLALSVLTLPAEAQRLGPAPKRPRHATLSDTNDARAYLEFGIRTAERDAESAAAAFYWAARLDPTSGDALYGRAMGLVMSDQSLWRNYMKSSRRSMQGKDLRRIDSLLFRAHTMDPFLFRRLERAVITGGIRQDIKSSMSASEAPGDGEIDYSITQYLSTAGAEMQGWMAYSASDFTQALSYYAQAMKLEKYKAWFHIERGRIFGRLARQDSAIAEFQAALTEMRARDAKDLVILYDSKAVLEHSIAVLLEQKDDVAGAREAYGRALQEDLSYYPAHLRLGLLAVALKDTATAFSELETAVQVAPAEPHPRLMAAVALLANDQADRAIPHLLKAIEIEPMWAAPYAALAQAYERKAKGPEALAAYTGFFAHAARNNPLLPQMTERMNNLKEFLGVKP